MRGVKITLNLRGRVSIFTKDEAPFKETDHKRDASGKFSKMASHLGTSPTGFGAHKKEEKEGWQRSHAKLIELGFKPKQFTKKPGDQTHQSTQSYEHPDGYKAMVAFSHNWKGGANEKTTTTFLYPSDAEQLEGFKEHKPPAPAAQPLTIKPVDDDGDYAVAKEASKHAHQLSHNGSEKAAAEALSLHDKAQKMRPTTDGIKAVRKLKEYTRYLKDIDSALDQKDPHNIAEALKKVKIRSKHTEVLAYRDALVEAHTAAPGGIPLAQENKLNAMADAFAHPVKNTQAPAIPSGKTGKLVAMGVCSRGKPFTATLDIDPGKIDPADLEALGKPPGQMSHGWDKIGKRIRTSQGPKLRHASAEYQGSTYRPMNRALAGLPPQPPEAHIVELNGHMDKAVNSAVVPMDVTLRRGISASLSDIIGADASNPEGVVFEHKGFVSASRSNGFQRQTNLIFNVPKGATGLPMPHLGQEHEIVLPKSAMFRIDKVEQAGTSSLVYCTYLGAKTDG